MELPLRVGPVDNLFITPEGNLVMAEVKLWGNPEARRTVVAQVLEYATELFRLDYVNLEAAVKRADLDGVEPPQGLYSLVDGLGAPPESVFADRVTRNLREGRIVVLIVGDEIRPAADELVAGLQAHANFRFTFALVAMPVYALRSSDAVEECLVLPQTLVKTVDVPRFTIRTEGGATIIDDEGTDEREARRPSRRSTISAEEFFEAMRERSPDVPNRLKQFLDEVDAVDVRVEYAASLLLKWDQPEGRPVNLGIIKRSGEIQTDASYWKVDRDLADGYNQSLARLFGGKVRRGKSGKMPFCTVSRDDDSLFRIEEIVDRLPAWRQIIENFQIAIRARAQDTAT